MRVVYNENVKDIMELIDVVVQDVYKRGRKDYVLLRIREMSYEVAGVQYKSGYPFFTIYENNQWITKSAKSFIPLEAFIPNGYLI